MTTTEWLDLGGRFGLVPNTDRKRPLYRTQRRVDPTWRDTTPTRIDFRPATSIDFSNLHEAPFFDGHIGKDARVPRAVQDATTANHNVILRLHLAVRGEPMAGIMHAIATATLVGRIFGIRFMTLLDAQIRRTNMLMVLTSLRSIHCTNGILCVAPRPPS